MLLEYGISEGNDSFCLYSHLPTDLSYLVDVSIHGQLGRGYQGNEEKTQASSMYNCYDHKGSVREDGSNLVGYVTVTTE